MHIQVLYLRDCPNHEPTVELVEQIVRRMQISANVQEIEVTPECDLCELKFVGSPTVLVNGEDIEPACRYGAIYGFCCRTYNGNGLPSESMIEIAVRRHQSS